MKEQNTKPAFFTTGDLWMPLIHQDYRETAEALRDESHVVLSSWNAERARWDLGRTTEFPCSMFPKPEYA
jgi:hypothetical protein